jgi:N-acetylglutamate synthase
MVSVEISLFHINDYDEVYTLWQRVFPDNNDSSYDRTHIARFLDRNPETSFIARQEGKLTGVILCGQDGRRGCIYHFAVDGEQRGKGIGKLLLKKAEDVLKEMGIPRIQLSVFRNNTEAVEFYQHSGFDRRDELHVFTKNL